MELEDYLPLLAELDQLSLMADSFVDGGAYMNAAKKPMIERLNVNQETKDYIYSSRTIVKDQVATLKERGIPVEKLTVNFMENEKGQRIDYEQAWEILRKYPAFNPVSGRHEKHRSYEKRRVQENRSCLGRKAVRSFSGGNDGFGRQRK